jgi:hypothetical protein
MESKDKDTPPAEAHSLLVARFRAASTPDAMLACLTSLNAKPPEASLLLAAVAASATQADLSAIFCDLAEAIKADTVTIAKAEVAQAARDKKAAMPDGWWTVDLARRMRSAMTAFGGGVRVRGSTPQQGGDPRDDPNIDACIGAWVADDGRRDGIVAKIVESVEGESEGGKTVGSGGAGGVVASTAAGRVAAASGVAAAGAAAAIRVNALEQLVTLVLYHDLLPHLPAYIEDLRRVTLNLIATGTEDEAMNAIEFWSTVADEEAALQDDEGGGSGGKEGEEGEEGGGGSGSGGTGIVRGSSRASSPF